MKKRYYIGLCVSLREKNESDGGNVLYFRNLWFYCVYKCRKSSLSVKNTRIPTERILKKKITTNQIGNDSLETTRKKMNTFLRPKRGKVSFWSWAVSSFSDLKIRLRMAVKLIPIFAQFDLEEFLHIWRDYNSLNANNLHAWSLFILEK